jgi:pimeloyl-ACP methyl ester carboxylesterase
MVELSGDLAASAVDLPGFGWSPPPQDGDWSLRGRVRAVLGYLEHEYAAGGPVHLIGNSLGGTVALCVAAERPDLVATLTLISPALPERRPRIAALVLGLLSLPGIARLITR